MPGHTSTPVKYAVAQGARFAPQRPEDAVCNPDLPTAAEALAVWRRQREHLGQMAVGAAGIG
ncbi:MAG: hypothetical protein HUU25_09080 [Candidatus Sumerlaeia bacterium]|nr:hypothetical protein [Candidatus Sumerlaeia bacterium]